MHTALVVDDHPFIRSALKASLISQNFVVLSEADNGAEAIKLARDLDPDLITLDISMPKLDGLEVIQRLKAFDVRAKVLVFTSLSPQLYAPRCLSAGAAGFLSKAEDMESFVKAVHALADGYMFFPHLSFGSKKYVDSTVSDAELIAGLSNREIIVLQKLSLGFSNKEVGELMLLSNKAVSACKTRLLEKLSLNSVIALAEFSKRNGLI
ncbi:two-component system, NarL family, response regulator EvgA [Pseudomonas koreensis]|uniref:response regulator transcription factor n=1 Tax=Pseudomonas koreensis TaxID=198620 RepID=UPI00087A8BA2|nr:response regulator transcription factor [Pseudomonas koreensis]KAB0507598.1 response regulator transcription factor [Pseudomonas koreensis]NNA64935.1 response regulator transcription factor [Pseudomonas koreensis]GGK53514.1 DNA-binding response regulator [Pseudomonas koreensis]SDE39520.1 two-component system, NarL family, response regulator EvgA [Pseudomonas koreensis]